MLTRARVLVFGTGVNVMALAAAGGARAKGHAAKGEWVFRKCMACHEATPDIGKKAGPNLHNVVGRTAGTLADYTFSDAMVAVGAAGLVWSPGATAGFVENPKTQVPGTKMTFAGLKKDTERADLVACLLLQSDTPAAPAP